MAGELTIKCGGCGEEFSPDHADYVRGTWRVCPACRDGPEVQGIGSHEGTSQTLSGANNASSWERDSHTREGGAP